ncbi:MAG: sulfotransferase [Cyanobacteria bacterium P01_D01_bin.50]
MTLQPSLIRSIGESRVDMLLSDEIKSNLTLSLREKAELIWSISHQNILTFLNQIPAERQHSVKYEDLVQNPQNTVEKLCNFLKLKFQSDRTYATGTFSS